MTKTAETKALMDLVVERFVAEQRYPLFVFILDEYFKLVHSEPLLGEILARLEKEFSDKDLDPNPIFNSIDEIVNLESISVVDGKLQSNLWFIFGYLSELVRGLAVVKAGYQVDGLAGVQKSLQDIIASVDLPKDKEALKSIEPGFDKKVFDSYLKQLNEALVTELVAKDFLGASESSMKLKYDPEGKVLLVRGHSVKIVERGTSNNAHYLLQYIFNNPEGIDASCPYAEIAMSEYFGDQYEKETSWKTYHRACVEIKSKVAKATQYKIQDFLVCGTGKRGEVNINPKYLES